jgi:hypothetical protein
VTRFFIDTTIHLERWAGEKSVREEIGDIFSSSTGRATSTHVQREWKRIVEGTAAEISNILRTKPTNIQELCAKLSTGYGRVQAQRFLVLGIIIGPEQRFDIDTMAISANRLMRFQARVMFEADIDEIRDESACALARNKVVIRPDGQYVFTNPELGRPTCKKSDEVCEQTEYLQRRLDRVKSAGVALTQSKREPDRKMGNAALRAVSDRTKRKGQNCYQKLGDISIALECRPDEVLLTTDRSFEVMAPAIGIQVQRLSGTSSIPTK